MFNNSTASHFLGASGRRGSNSSTASSTSSSPFFPTSILQNNAFNVNQQNNPVKGTPPILATGYYFQQYQKQFEQNKSSSRSLFNNSPSTIQRQSPQEIPTTQYRTSTVTGKQSNCLEQDTCNNSSMNIDNNNNTAASTISTFSTDLSNSQHSMNSQQDTPVVSMLVSSQTSTPTLASQQQQHKITNSTLCISPFGDFENEPKRDQQGNNQSGSAKTTTSHHGQHQQKSKKLITSTSKNTNNIDTRQTNFQNKQIVVSPNSVVSSLLPVTGSSSCTNEKTSSSTTTTTPCRRVSVSPENLSISNNTTNTSTSTGNKPSLSFLVLGEKETTLNSGVANTLFNNTPSSSSTLTNNYLNNSIVGQVVKDSQEKNLENYSTNSSNNNNNTRTQSAGIVSPSPKEHQFRKTMSVSTASSNNNMMMNPPSSSSPTKPSPHLTSPLKSNANFTSMKPPSSTSSSSSIIPSPSNNRKPLDNSTTPTNDNSTPSSSSSSHNPPPNTSSPNPTSSPKIPALESEPPTVKLPSIYAVLLNDKDPYLSQGKDQNSEIIYLRPIAKMVENSKKKQSCHAQFGNNIVKKQSSLRSKIRGLLRRDELKKQITSNPEENDKKDQSSENNLTVDVKSSDFNLDNMTDDANIMAFGSSEDFGLMYNDMMGLDDQDFMSTWMNDDNLGLLSDQPNSNVSTPLLERETMRRSSSAMKHDVSQASLSSFISSPATPMTNLPIPAQTKEGQMSTNPSSFWDSSMSGSLDNIPVSSGNFFVPSAAKNTSSSNSMSGSSNNSSRMVPNEPVRKQQEVSTINNLTPNRGVTPIAQNNVQNNQMNKQPNSNNNPVMNNFNASNLNNMSMNNTNINTNMNNNMNANMNTNMNSNMNNNMNTSINNNNNINNNINSMMNNMNSMVNNMNNSMMANNMGNNKSMNNMSNINNNMSNMNNMNNMNMNNTNNNNNQLGMNQQQQQMTGMQNNMFSNNGMNNSAQNDSTSNFDTNNFFNISTDTLLQGILYAQKSGINLASLFALTLQQQQNQASSYNESTNGFGNNFKNNNSFNNMNNGNMFNNNVFSNMGSEMFPNQNPISQFPNNNQHNQFQKSQDNSQLLLQKLLDSNQLNSSNVQNSFTSRQQQNDNMFNMNNNNNLSSQIDSLMMNKNNMLNMSNNNNQMLYNQLNNQQTKFNQNLSPQNQQLNSPRQNNPLMAPSNLNTNRFIKTESDLASPQPNWKDSYEEPEVVSLSTPRAVGTKTAETKRIKIKQDTISSPPQPTQETNDSSHEEDDESVSSNPQSPDKNGKKKRKSHVTASQVGIIELENTEGFECSYCLRKFKRKSDIKVHIRRHTGERPYICEIDGCGKAFTTASNLRRHNRNVHTKE